MHCFKRFAFCSWGGETNVSRAAKIFFFGNLRRYHYPVHPEQVAAEPFFDKSFFIRS